MFRPETTTFGRVTFAGVLATLPALAFAEPKAGFSKDSAGPVAQEIAAVKTDADWAKAVSAIVVRQFDTDKSGGIGPREIAGIPCDVWAAIDVGSKAQARESASVVYGFDAAFVWAGSALGFEPASRAQGAAMFSSCTAPAGPKDDGAQLLEMLAGNGAPTTVGAGSGVASRISGIGPTGGSGDWDVAAKDILVKSFDQDGSGDLGDSEVGLITCDVWSALDAGVKETYAGGLYAVYGFAPPGIWIGSAIGINVGSRRLAARNLKGCTETGAIPAPSNVSSSISSIPDQGGGSDWDARAKEILLSEFDLDQSGEIDTKDEVEAIDCDTWGAMDKRIREQWTSMYVTYGFDLSLSWIAGSTLGISQGVRGQASGAVLNCGLSDDTSPAAQISALPNGGGSDWDASVASIMTANYDADGDGQVEAGKKELDQIPCAVWLAIDGGVRYTWSGGLRQTYGFKSGTFLGHAIGVNDKARKKAAKAIDECAVP
jgi:hypothetical protein